ncbi:MAG: FtsX-like permease family protein, partial [Pseudomonadota bacterium]
MRLPPSVRFALRELRGGLAGFRIFLACLALGVGAIAAVGSVRTAIQEGLTREASSLLGGDAEARFTYRFASEAERAWLNANATEVSEIVDFRSLATAEVGGETERALAQVKGVDAFYPLYGEVVLEPEMPLSEALDGTAGLPGLVAEGVLVARLGLEVGDVMRLGTQEFELRAIIEREPDGLTSGFALGPRIIVATDALAESGLLTPGTLFETAYRMRFDPSAVIGPLRRDALRQFRDTGLRWRDNRDGTPGIARFVDRLSSFLVLVGLAGLAVGGVGVAAAVRSFLERKTETIATLKTLGATGDGIFTVYFVQIGLLSLLGVALGLLLGAGVPTLLGPFLADRLPVPALFGIYPRPLAEAAFYGTLTALIFTLWPLARARGIRAAALFRDASEGTRGLPPTRFVALIFALACSVIAGAAWFSGIPTLALWTAAGILAALFGLALAALGTRALARRLARSSLTRGRPALRLALSAVGGPGGETQSVILSLGLGLTVLAAIGQIDANLRGVITRDLPDVAPAFFFVDIQTDQLSGFRGLSMDAGGAERVETAPMLRGIITRLNDQPAGAYVRSQTGEGHWSLRGDRGVTYAQAMPDGTLLTEGEWWAPDYDGPPVMSFAAEEAEEMGLQLGDRMTVNVLGRDITAEIVNFRVVEFQNMGINFLITLNPGALAGAPHTHIATVYAEEAREAPLLRGVADAYPNITAVPVREAIARAAEALDGLSTATRYGAAATLVTGFIVLIGAA